MSSSRKKFSHNLDSNLDQQNAEINSIQEDFDQSIGEQQFDQSIGQKLEKENLDQYKENNFVESVGNEYNQLMNELGARPEPPSSKFKQNASQDQVIPFLNREFKILNKQRQSWTKTKL